MTDLRIKKHEDIAEWLDRDVDSPEMKKVQDSLLFEKKMIEEPIPEGVGSTDVFGYEQWDFHAITKGNYWQKGIFSTSKLIRLALAWNIETQKKYLRKKNLMDFDWTWIIILVIIGVVALLAIIFLLPQLGGAI